MAVNFTQQKKKQKYLLYLVGLVILAIVIVLYFGYFRNKEVIPIDINLVPEIMPAALNRITIDTEVLENPFLKQLEPFEGLAPYEGEKGRSNPFVPY